MRERVLSSYTTLIGGGMIDISLSFLRRRHRFILFFRSDIHG
jgi:hypothetical protein